MRSVHQCRGLMKALKKLRFYLFGRHFTVETDAQTLVWILNQPPNDLPNALLTCWATYIRLFDFDVRHVPGTKNGAADALSRRGGKGPEDEDEAEDEAEDYFEARLYAASIVDMSDVGLPVYFRPEEYSGDDRYIGEFLSTLQRPAGLEDDDFNRIRWKAKQFLARDGFLFKLGRRAGDPPKRVIEGKEQRRAVIQELHDELGHRSFKATFQLVSRRYQWKGVYKDVQDFVRTYGEYQRRKGRRVSEPLHPTWSSAVWVKLGVDVVYMPEGENGEKFAVFARDDVSGWVEGRALKHNSSAAVAKFIFEDVICRHGYPERIVMDGGPENKKEVEDLLAAHGIRRVPISAYHPQSNGLVERGHEPIVSSIAKYCQGAPEEWPRYLPLALWADRIMVRRTTGYSAFRLMYGRDCVLPVETSIASWGVVDWNEVQTTEDLLLTRMKQLDERVLDEARAVNKVYFDRVRRVREEWLKVGDLVLVLQQSGGGISKAPVQTRESMVRTLSHLGSSCGFDVLSLR